MWIRLVSTSLPVCCLAGMSTAEQLQLQQDFEASDSLPGLIRAPYVLYGVKYIDLVYRVPYVLYGVKYIE